MSDLIQIVEDVVHVSVDETRVEVVSVGVQGPQGALTTVEGLGLDRVDNTRDLEKPVSEAQADAIEAARDAAEDYTDVVAALKADVSALLAVVNALTGEVDFPSINRTVSVRTPGGLQGQIAYNDAVSVSTLARRSSTQTLKAASGVAPDDLVPKVQFDAAVPIRGTGFPSGVVAAPVGSTYIDTAATNGAIEWKKATRTGNTGSVVSHGEIVKTITGANLLNGWDIEAASPTISRNGNIVTLTIPSSGLRGTSATSNIFYGLPSGFRIASPGNYGHVGYVQATGGAATSVSKDFANLACSARTKVAGILQWRTSDAWPTT